MILRPPIATRTDTPVTTRRSSDLRWRAQPRLRVRDHRGADQRADDRDQWIDQRCQGDQADTAGGGNLGRGVARAARLAAFSRSEEHTSELQSLMRISYAVFCLKKTNTNKLLNNQVSPTHN